MSAQPIAALYLRSAIEDDAAIAEQRRLCVDHAASQGWFVGEVIVDNGASGVQERPGLAALRACIAEGRAQIVLATAPARIARDPQMFLDIANFCEARGAPITFAKGGSAACFGVLNLHLYSTPSWVEEMETEVRS